MTKIEVSKGINLSNKTTNFNLEFPNEFSGCQYLVNFTAGIQVILSNQSRQSHFGFSGDIITFIIDSVLQVIGSGTNVGQTCLLVGQH